jgi:gas vesicle protein
MSKSAKKFAVGALLAAAAGYVAGILTAPKSGKETREDIKEGVEHGVAEAEKQLKKLHTELNQLLDEARSRASEFKGKAQDEMDKAVEAAKVVKDKTRELLSAVHEGDAEDRDLKKAVTEASKAVQHLKTYLKK